MKTPFKIFLSSIILFSSNIHASCPGGCGFKSVEEYCKYFNKKPFFFDYSSENKGATYANCSNRDDGYLLKCCYGRVARYWQHIGDACVKGTRVKAKECHSGSPVK